MLRMLLPLARPGGMALNMLPICTRAALQQASTSQFGGHCRGRAALFWAIHNGACKGSTILLKHTVAHARAVHAAVGVQGDAEDLPFATDSFDRYVSAGSIEYWPEPQRGIKEAYRWVCTGFSVFYPLHP